MTLLPTGVPLPAQPWDFSLVENYSTPCTDWEFLGCLYMWVRRNSFTTHTAESGVKREAEDEVI